MIFLVCGSLFGLVGILLVCGFVAAGLKVFILPPRSRCQCVVSCLHVSGPMTADCIVTGGHVTSPRSLETVPKAFSAGL